jgi:hypothetical protein
MSFNILRPHEIDPSLLTIHHFKLERLLAAYELFARCKFANAQRTNRGLATIAATLCGPPQNRRFAFAVGEEATVSYD